MIVLVHRSLLPKNILGLALWPFLIIKDVNLKVDAVFMNHERIHLRQQQELLLVFFYVWYGIEYGIRLLQCKDQQTAYRTISFEREAYKEEVNLQYLEKRSFWRFVHFL